MFSFFEKKKFLVDYLGGFVDIHNHILPGIDDGAKTVHDSIALIKGFSEIGITNFICTPHIMHNYYNNTPKTIKKSYKTLKQALKKENIGDIKVDYAAEHMIDDNFEFILEKGEVLPIGGQNLLIEMSFLQPSINFDVSIQKITSKGYFPILAHPERYFFFHNDFQVYQKLKKQNILFQINLLSLTGYYGSEIKNIAIKLLDKGLIDFLGSDMHNISQLKAIKDAKLPVNLLEKINTVIVHTIEHFH
ncbi:MAG: CpsB/CapC family capsule biosynthesis tyrosine phosphatase [Bacteroidota bacterium]